MADSSGPNSGVGGQRMSTFGLGVSQMLRQKRWQREARSGLFQVGDSTETQDSNLTQYQDSSMARDEPPEYQSTGGIHDHGREASPLPTSAADILPVPKIHYPPGVQRDLDAGTPAESIDESMHLIDFADGDRDEVDLLRITTSSPGGSTMAGSKSLPSLVHTPDTKSSSSASPPRHSKSPTPSIKSRSGSRHSVSEPHPVSDVGALSISDSSGDGSVGPSVSKASTLELLRDAATSSPPPPPPLLREAAIKEDSDSSESDSRKPGEDPRV